MKKILLATVLLYGTFLNAQELHLVPEPVSTEINTGTFAITPATGIVAANAESKKTAAYLNQYLHKHYGFTLPILAKKTTRNIVLDNSRKPGRIPGAYTLEINGNQVFVKGDNEGVFYAMQTLIQLLPLQPSKQLAVPQLRITDSARFSYRGMHLDVARHFFPVSYVKKYIDFIAMHKMNILHWHLTEDQGWRIEIKKYPKLIQTGAYRNGTIIGRYPGVGNTNTRYGGYYTQAEVKEIVKYAADRYITVIPEIELPGHASAAIAAYPELSCFPKESTKILPGLAWNGDTTRKQVTQYWGVFPDVFCPTETTFSFLQNVLDEVMNLFPGRYIHIGGDECPKEYWKRSAFCQQLIKDKGLKDEHELQSYFIQRIEKYLNKKGRQIIGWDEILEGGLAPNATVMSWRGEKGGIEAAKLKHQVIMTPSNYAYFDHSQVRKDDSVTIGGYLPVQKVYSYEPIPNELTEEEGQYIIGAQANVWTEYISNPSKLEYMVFPRMSALSEVLWSPKQTRKWSMFEKKMPALTKLYNWWGVQYSKAYLDPANN